MKPESINKIDQLLEELENIGEEQLPETLPNFLNSVCDAVNLPHDALFNPTNGPQQKKFIAVCLLRLLCRNEEAIWQDMDLRINTFNLFDNQINSIYHNLNITEDDQNHEKLKKLLGTEGTVLENFSDIADSIVSLDMLSSIRQNFMSNLNFQENKLFLEQFVTPPSLINTDRINLVFETVQAYNESSMEDLVISYHNLENVFDPFLRAAEKNRSIFTEQCIVAPVQKIYDYIRDDFENNDAIKPTTVTIAPLDRKYPLHVIGKKIEVKYRVENQGPGYAVDVQIECEMDEGLTQCNTKSLGNLGQHQSSERILKTAVEDEIKGNPIVIGQISWRNYDKERVSDEFVFELIPQRTDLNWQDLESKQPYSLEAVNEAEDLVGRTRLMGQLNARLSANRIESSIIHGQKRVGKTSIAEVIQANFMEFTNYSVIFVAINGLDTTTPDRFVADLGKTIVDQISRAAASFGHIEKPQFESALSPLRDYLQDVKTVSPEPNHKFIIILDEFDEIPPDMLQVSSSVGQTFFNNIRAISSTGHVGFVLVGGENMQIIRESTDQLNKMSSFRVDYFDKEQYWSDFQDLVRRPMKNTIEFNNEAINALYEITEGHPFYTKAICREIYTTACEARSAYISEDNVEKAVQVTIESLDLNAVSHFWIDGISKRYAPAQRDEIQTERRRFLIAFAQIKRSKKSVSKQDLRASELLRNVDVDKIIDQYITRGFLIEETDHYRWKPKFFERWLIERGFSMLTSEFLDEEAIIRLKQEEEEAYVSPKEIVNLCDNWGLYRGSKITSDNVRAWLEQFEYNIEQRLMFNLLQHVRFYSEEMIREKISGLHKKVQQNVAKRGGITPGDRRERRKDILLSSFGSLAQSGPSYARIYRIENRITTHNVANSDKIPAVLEENDHIKTIVFVDDIIASGESVVGSLNKLNNTCGELIRDKQVKVFISVICGLHIGIKKLEDAINDVPFDAEIIVSDYLDEADQCFTDQSKIFGSPSDRDRAKQIALEYGKKLKERPPLGYRNSQLLVAFYDNCPNNTLPILWKESTRKVKWTPLFKRN